MPTLRVCVKSVCERVSRHLAEKHDVPEPERRGLSAFVASIGLIDPNDVSLRPDDTPQHEALGVVNGYACLHYDFRTTSPDLIGRHLSKSHGWKGTGKRDGWQRDGVRSNTPLAEWRTGLLDRPGEVAENVAVNRGRDAYKQCTESRVCSPACPTRRSTRRRTGPT